MVDLVSLFTSEVLRKQKITKAMIKAAALLTARCRENEFIIFELN